MGEKYLLEGKKVKLCRSDLPASSFLSVQSIPPSDLPCASYCMLMIFLVEKVKKKKVHMVCISFTVIVGVVFVLPS